MTPPYKIKRNFNKNMINSKNHETTTIEVGQITRNLHKSENSATKLRQIFKDKKNFILLLQEPHFNKKGNISQFHNCFVHAEKDKVTPRAAIVASKNVSLWPQPELSTQDVATCLWSHRDNRIINNNTSGTLIVSVYWEDKPGNPHNDSLPPHIK